jgi:hypothetical protein
MSEKIEQHPITMKRVLYEIPGMDAVRIQHGIEYRVTDAGALTMDLYCPPAIARLKASRSTSEEGEPFRRAEPIANAAPIPAVVIVAGYSDVGYKAFTGCAFKDTGFCVSWAQLMAASGVAAITYTNREPATDLRALLHHVRQNAASLGIDANRIGIWASSGNVPLALSELMQDDGDFLKCAVLCYGFTLDLEGSTAVAEAAGTFKFVNPNAGKSVADLPQHLPLFVARAGRDEFPHLNETLDRFVAGALACNLPVTIVNHPAGPHAFDLVDDSEVSREIVRQILAFMRFHLLPFQPFRP